MPPCVAITVYTDPLCVWSWAAEAPWRQLHYEFADQIAWRSVMAGLLSGWGQYDDPLNAVSRPAQMGPLWRHAAQLTGAPVSDQIWAVDPPASSYPACVAVKAAEGQGAAAGEAYLRRAREAALLEGRNIGRSEVLLALADELAARGALDPARFRDDLGGPTALEAFRADLGDVRYRDLGRFPTLIMRGGEGAALLLVGYRPYAALRAALNHLAPGLRPARCAADALSYAAHWGSLTAHEAAAALGCDSRAAAAALEAACADGRAMRYGQLYRYRGGF